MSEFLATPVRVQIVRDRLFGVVRGRRSCAWVVTVDHGAFGLGPSGSWEPVSVPIPRQGGLPNFRPRRSSDDVAWCP